MIQPLPASRIVMGRSSRDWRLSAEEVSTYVMTRSWGKALSAGGLYGVGLLLHQLPTLTRPGQNLLPSDWKALARVGLGVASVQQLNQFLGLQLPPWAQGLASVLLIHPMMMKFSANTFKQVVAIAPMIAGIAQGTHALNQWVKSQLSSQDSHTQLAARVGVSVGVMALSLAMLPAVYKQLGKLRWFAPAFAKTAQAQTSALLATCPRGCTVGGIICLSELGELMSSLGLTVRQWISGKTVYTNKEGGDRI